jgi:ribonucleoside-diphosphate reductase alpha chain
MEIVENTSDTEIASCNLCSISLNECVKPKTDGTGNYFDFDELERITARVVRNVNQAIDRTYYPPEIPEIKYANLRHRPLGVGVQGLADAVALLDISWVIENPEALPSDPWEIQIIISPQIKKLNREIFETMYYAGIRESAQMAKETSPYETFPGSPASEGYFQFDLWDQEKLEKTFNDQKNASINVNLIKQHREKPRKSRYSSEQWESLRVQMKQGIRNSLIFAMMPTASSAHILGNNECFEPFTQIIMTRTVLSGQYGIVNKHVVVDLKRLGIWTTDTVKNIMNNKGSIQQLPNLSDPIKNERLQFLKLKYRTVFEIPQKVIAQLSIGRGPYICQTQSVNCHMAEPTISKLTAWHFYMWKKGAKTGMYYLRQSVVQEAINYAITSIKIPDKTSAKVVCTDEVCVRCQT